MPDQPRFGARLLDLRTYDELSRAIIRLEADRGSVPLMAPKGIMRLIYLEQIPTRAANIIKQEILARGGDLVTPWMAADFASERVDAIVIGNLVTLRSTVAKLFRQTVYQLPQIAAAIQDVLVKTTPGYLPVARDVNRQGVVVEETLDDLHGGRIPLGPGHRARGKPTLVAPYGRPDWRWAWGARTYLVGVLDLPAAGAAAGADAIELAAAGVEAAVARGLELAAAGADVIEVAAAVAAASAVAEVIRRLRRELPAALMAVATGQAAVAAAALAAGANLIHGAPGLRPELAAVAAQHQAPLSIRHHPSGHGHGDPMADMARWFDGALDLAARAGVRPEQVILDPGSGGQSHHRDLICTRRLRELTSFGRPLLYTPPRPAGAPGGVDPAAEDAGAAAAIALAIANGADLVRVRNVPAMQRCLQMSDALRHADADTEP